MSRGLPPLSKIPHGETVLDVEYYLRRDYENIQLANEEIPHVICWLGEVRSWSYKRVADAESAWDKAKASAYFALKNGGEFVARGFGDKPTEEALKHAMQLDPVVRECAASYAEFKRRLIHVDETIECLKLKIDLIRSTETTRRIVADDSRKNI